MPMKRGRWGKSNCKSAQVSESVTITADAVSVNTTNGERAGTLSGEQLDEIALRGRDLFDAISLMPGVVDTSDGRDSPSPTSISNIYILGGRNDSKNMTIDGVSNLDTGSNTTVHSMPSMDSVAEVKVLMSAYSAENGRNPSSINVITRGGGQQYHGLVSWYFRNEDLNANNYFSNEAGRPRQEYRYNIASYYLGGPVIIPKIYDGRNKLFFFFNQEFQDQVVSYAVNEKTVPTALERAGRFLAVVQHQRQQDYDQRSAEREEGISREYHSGFAHQSHRAGDTQDVSAAQFRGSQSRDAL